MPIRGYNQQQEDNPCQLRQIENQLAWADFWEYGRDGRGGSYSFGRRFHTYCKDCQAGNDFACADSVRLFIQNHKGHKTSFFSKK